MNKKNKAYKGTVIVFLLIVFFGMLYLSFNKNINISLTYLKDIIYKPFTDITNNKSDIIGKNINSELVDENNSLKNIASIENSLSDFKKINATIIERNNSFWLDSMTLNKGKKDGVDIGMAVVVGEGLIGRISTITNNTSKVKLITSGDNNNKISVKFKNGDKYVYKILELEGESLVIKGIDNNINIGTNIPVLTSGLSDIYPSGIIIGTIFKTENDKYNVSKKLYVKSKVDFENLRFVTILERQA